MEDNVKLHCDHILPKSKGGSNDLDNLVTSCSECNLGKGDVILSQRIIEKIQKRFHEGKSSIEDQAKWIEQMGYCKEAASLLANGAYVGKRSI